MSTTMPPTRAKWRILVVVGATMQYFVVNGPILNYSVLFVDLQDEFQDSAVVTGWIGALFLSLYCTIAPVAAVLGSRFGNLQLLSVGLVLESLGFLLTSFIPSLVYGYLTFGLMSGLGAGFTLFASSSLLLDWYSGHPSCCRATGTPTLGGSLGVMALGPLLNTTNAAWGWRNSLRLLSGIVLLIGILGALPFLKTPETSEEQADITLDKQPNKREHCSEVNEYPTPNGKAVDVGIQTDCGDLNDSKLRPGQDRCSGRWKTLKKLLLDADMWLFVLSITCSQLGWSFVVINFTSFMKGILLTTGQINVVLLVFGAAGFGGKLVFIAFGDRLRFQKLYIIAATSVGGAITAGFQVMSSTFVHMIALSIVWAVARGGMYAACLAAGDELFRDYGSDAVASITFSGFGLGVLIGSSVTGALYDLFGNYRLSLYILVASFVLSTASMLLIPIKRKVRSARRSPQGVLGSVNSAEVKAQEGGPGATSPRVEDKRGLRDVGTSNPVLDITE